MSSSSSSGPTPSSPSRDQPSWHTRAMARAKLTADEWQERSLELQEKSTAWLRERRERGSQLSLNDSIERSHYRWRAANDRFDDWFNAQWPVWEVDMRAYGKDLQKRYEEGKLIPFSKETGPRKIIVPFDLPAMALVFAGLGSVVQGATGIGVVCGVWGTVRGVRRWVVKKVDAEDRDGLMKWAPASWSPAKRAEMFNRIQYQVHFSRQYRLGTPGYTSYDMTAGRKEHKGMDPLNDYTPETLYEDAMECVMKHPRVLETLGEGGKHVAEPDKVVYRIVEGIAEVYMAWRVTGPTAAAEIQVKSSACLLDYIYVFPEPVGRYQMTLPAFVIRPNGGDWSQNVDELGKYQKSPFGKKGDTDRLYHNRSGVFEYDWTIRDFKHGKENRFAERWR